MQRGPAGVGRAARSVEYSGKEEAAGGGCGTGVVLSGGANRAAARHIWRMFTFDNSYARDLTGAFVAQAPAVPPEPRTVILNERLAAEMGLDAADLTAAALSGAAMPAGAQPIAQAYAGHQFGGFSPSLGDGRAVLLGEHLSPDGRRWDIHLKGSGPTPFSRGGDGYAALGPMLREYLMGEAMHALGVPTTQALAVVATGAPVFRETPLPGAVLVRVAASHLRVGTFQFFAARGDTAMLKRLVAYAIARHYPDLAGAENPALALWDAVAARQIDLIAEWMGLGFIHGVMNTDNMTISGETIDYGPCAFMDAYAPGTVFSSIDRQGRYAFANQPLILGWNLARLAEALVPVIGEDGERTVEMLNERLQGIAGRYRQAWVGVMNRKLAVKDDGTLADGLLAAMEGQGADWTLAFRRLADAVTDDATLAPLFADPGALRDWLPGWRAKLRPGAEGLLRQANPAVIPRNHLVEEALAAATGGDMAPFHALADALSRPFDPAPERFALPPPAGLAPHVTFCGT